jgi:hypothetical protein
MLEMREPLYDKNQTGNRIKELCRRFYSDLSSIYLEKNGQQIPLSSLTLKEFFNFVRNIPYRQDKKPIEIVARPYHILRHKSLGMDCKKKSVLLGAFCEYQGIPYRFIASSRRADKQVHHVFPQAQVNGRFVNVDATYPEYSYGQKKNVTYAEVL